MVPCDNFLVSVVMAAGSLETSREIPDMTDSVGGCGKWRSKLSLTLGGNSGSSITVTPDILGSGLGWRAMCAKSCLWLKKTVASLSSSVCPACMQNRHPYNCSSIMRIGRWLFRSTLRRKPTELDVKLPDAVEFTKSDVNFVQVVEESYRELTLVIQILFNQLEIKFEETVVTFSHYGG